MRAPLLALALVALTLVAPAHAQAKADAVDPRIALAARIPAVAG